MPRTGRRRLLSIAAVTIATLAAPAAAQAVTYTVAPNEGACSAGDTKCGSLSAAAAAAAPGDVFNVAPATYGSATFDVGGITITGAPNFIINGSLVFTGSGAPVKLEKAAITQPNGSTTAVVSTGTAGLQISDSLIFGVYGDGVSFTDSAANRIIRTVVVTGGTETAAVKITSSDASTSAKGLHMESALLSGGLNALLVKTGEGLLSAAGPITATLRHVTLAGATHGATFDASQANPPVGGPVGNITATVTDSIIEKDVVTKNYPGIILVAPANVVDVTYTRTLTNADGASLFVDPSKRNFRLKAGSPAIDQGGFTAGESTTDVEGQARPGPTTDLGADEYYPPPAGGTTPPPPPLGATNDGDLPKVVITSPKAGETIRLTTKTTKTVTVTLNGKKVKKKVTTTKRNRLRQIAGTSSDKSGIKGIVLMIQKTSTATAAKAASGTTTTTGKCRWFNATKGIVVKSCAKPIVLLAKLAKDGSWTYKIKSTLKLGAGKYRVITAALDNSGAFGNGAPTKDAVHSFTLVK